MDFQLAGDAASAVAMTEEEKHRLEELLRKDVEEIVMVCKN